MRSIVRILCVLLGGLVHAAPESGSQSQEPAEPFRTAKTVLRDGFTANGDAATHVRRARDLVSGIGPKPPGAVRSEDPQRDFIELVIVVLLEAAPLPDDNDGRVGWDLVVVPMAAQSAVTYGGIQPSTAVRVLGPELDLMPEMELFVAESLLRHARAYDVRSSALGDYIRYETGEARPPWYDLSYLYLRKAFRSDPHGVLRTFAEAHRGPGPRTEQNQAAWEEADALRAAAARVYFAHSLPRSDPERAQALEEANAVLRRLAQSPHPFARFYVATVLHDKRTIFDRSLLKKLEQDEDLFVVKAAEEALAQENAP